MQSPARLRPALGLPLCPRESSASLVIPLLAGASTEGRGPGAPDRPLAVAMVMGTPFCRIPPPPLGLRGRGKGRERRFWILLCVCLFLTRVDQGGSLFTSDGRGAPSSVGLDSRQGLWPLRSAGFAQQVWTGHSRLGLSPEEPGPQPLVHIPC